MSHLTDFCRRSCVLNSWFDLMIKKKNDINARGGREKQAAHVGGGPCEVFFLCREMLIWKKSQEPPIKT